VLADTVAWTFTTPPPRVLQFSPSGEGLPLDPLMIATFDQRINPDDVLAAIKVNANSASVPLRLATQAEIDADEAARAMIEQAGEGRWVAFRAQEPMAPDATVAVSFGPGLPSAEGPLETTESQEFSFRTHGPLAVVRYQCGWDNSCPPLMPWNIEFSNPLDAEAFDESQVSISPELPNAIVQVFGNTLQIQGRSQGRTTYSVRLSETIRDVYGQSLGADQTVTFAVGEAQPAIYAPGYAFRGARSCRFTALFGLHRELPPARRQGLCRQPGRLERFPAPSPILLSGRESDHAAGQTRPVDQGGDRVSAGQAGGDSH
jgi:hypothetical protein